MEKTRLAVSAWFVAAALLGAPVPPVLAQQGPLGGSIAGIPLDPLIIIRFNQRNVYFEKPLYTVVSKALETKPSVMFDLVLVIPTYGEAAKDERQAKIARANANKVVTTMRKMGLPASRITVTEQQSPVAESDEVHVFVR